MCLIREPVLKTIQLLICLGLLLLAGCSLPASTATPPPPGAATHRLDTPTPQPTASPLPTDPIWRGWLPSGTNLALRKHVKVSHETYGFGGAAAVDGSLRTRWNSGAEPTQWIEIDLGKAYDISEIRLVPGLDNPGVTVHNVLGRAPFLADYRLLYTFESQISDSPLLARPPGGLWKNIQFVRIETTFSPVPVGWKEIMVMGEEESGTP